ncbi:hypothetical protein PSTG_08281 [Puccinia striiformis f. sp. tritici PST-78]|uniref:FAR1 domain-containing protein n=1 Tax=Puccinia striiformis f. sp. tritici PST-78 TaxID=1165861 RepID=A0A0L0VGX9_9BASI|nr:hypothetical protein PSTG_08281 [Puccinia striiformis f. sp. tritici PST-78]
MTNNPHINPIFFQSPPNEVGTSSEVVTSSIPAPSADNSSIPALSCVDNIPTMDLLPPPELSYETQQELHDDAQQWAKNQGYAIIKGNTNLPEQRYNYKCDKSGKCQSTGAKSDGQLGKTKKTSCPFHFTGSFYKRTGLFQIKIKNPNHNHPPSKDPSVHPIHRRLKSDQKHLVEQLTHAGVAPLQIKSALMQESSTPISTTLSTTYNHRDKMRIESLQGRSPMEALFYEICKQGFYYTVRNDDEDADKDEAYYPFDTKLTASSATTHETYSSEGRTWSTHEELDVNQYKYKDNSPPRALQLISTITDVDGDGNCGLRAAAVSMGRESKTWSDIRKEMKDEVTANSLYSDQKFLVNVFGESAGNILEGLDWSESGMTPVKFWMTFPGHGYLLADTYKRPVVLFSKAMPSTYLPLSHPPTNTSTICLLLIEDISHIISFSFKDELWASPKLDPFWIHYAKEEAKPWEDSIQPNLNLGEEILFPKRRSSRLKIVDADA